MNIKLEIKHWTLIIFILMYSVYIYSAGRVNNGYGDSDEIITSSYLLSVAHPPGYPLQILLTNIFINLPLGGTVAFRANLFSGLCQAGTVAVIFLIVLKISQTIIKNEKERIIAGIISSLSLGFSAIFWLYGAVLEVHSLGNLIVVGIIYFALKWKDEFEKLKSAKIEKKEFKYFCLVSILIGLGIGHLQTTVLILPGLAYLFFSQFVTKKDWKEQVIRRVIVTIIIVGIFILVPNLLLFYFNSKQENFSWYFSQDWIGWWRHLTRAVYKGFYVERGTQIDSAYIAKFDLKKYARVFPYYLKFLGQHFTILPLIAAILGMDIWKAKDKKSFNAFLILFLITGPLFALYMGLPEEGMKNILYRHEIGVAHRQYLIGYVFLSMFVGLGVWKIWKILKAKKIGSMIFLGIILIGVMIGKNYATGVQRNNRLAYDFNKQILDTAKDGGVIYCSGDFSCFGMIYLQEVEKYRPEVKVIPYNIYIKRYFLLRNPQLKGFEKYADNPYHFTDLITWNLRQDRPSYFVDLDSYYIDYIGLDADPFYLIPRGYLFEITTKIEDEFESYDYDFSQNLIKQANVEKNYLLSGLRDYFANNHNSMGLLYSYVNMKDEARKNFKLAMELNPTYEDPQVYYETLTGFSGREDYLSVRESSSSAYYVNLAKKEIEERMLENAYNNLRKATYRDPLDSQSRLELAKLYKDNGYLEFSTYELVNLLKYDRENEDAIKMKEELEASRSAILQY